MAETFAESRRQWLMNELKENGTERLSKEELIELLLLYSGSKENSDEITDRLFEHFGSMSEVLEAPVSELVHVKGVRRNNALLLSMVPQIARRIQMDSDVKRSVKGMKEIREFVPKCFIGKTVEYFLLVCLDKKMKMIRYDFVSKGTVNSSTVDLRKMIHILLHTNAKYAVIAHNHPRGAAYPSNDDLRTTNVIVKAFNTIDVRLLDHFIVNSRGCFSIANAPSEISCCMKAD